LAQAILVQAFFLETGTRRVRSTPELQFWIDMGTVLAKCCCSPQAAEKRIKSEPDSLRPSNMAMKSSTPSVKNFKELDVVTPYAGDKKILVICTSKYLLEMDNGTYFNTGHQSSEIFVALYHLDKTGFEFDIATPDGAAVAIEEWTFVLAEGYEDKLRSIQSKLKAQLDAPMKLSEVGTDVARYAAVYLPGGHGPLIEQPKVEAIGAILRAAHTIALPTITLCHGPAALLAADIGGEFPYKGYKMVVFPDKTDKSTPMFGYLPGYIKEEDKLEKNLVNLGLSIQNTEMDDSTFVDRELISGASQLASQNLAVAAIKHLAEKYNFKVNA